MPRTRLRLAPLALASLLAAVALTGLAGCPAKIAPEPPSTGAGPLDGGTFVIELTDPAGDPSPDALVFASGHVLSSDCVQYGFGYAAYEASPRPGGAQAFTAEAHSAEEGSVSWSGTVRGDAIEGEVLWIKAGQDPVRYRFEGTRSP